MLTSVRLLASVVCLLAVSACLLAPASPAQAPPPATAEASRPVAASAAAAPVAPTAAALLRAAPGGDGDSWRDTAGKEYRLGLVNAPETNECYGTEATSSRLALTAKGFTAQVYARDNYGRDVSVVTTADGVNLNVHLARNGLANDKYLEQFRAENPLLGEILDQAFASAKAERAGLWGACGSARGPSPPATRPRASAPAAPPPAASSASCHPDYLTCIPVKGNGSAPLAQRSRAAGSKAGRETVLRAVAERGLRVSTAGLPGHQRLKTAKR